MAGDDANEGAETEDLVGKIRLHELQEKILRFLLEQNGRYVPIQRIVAEPYQEYRKEQARRGINKEQGLLKKTQTEQQTIFRKITEQSLRSLLDNRLIEKKSGGAAYKSQISFLDSYIERKKNEPLESKDGGDHGELDSLHELEKLLGIHLSDAISMIAFFPCVKFKNDLVYGLGLNTLNLKEIPDIVFRFRELRELYLNRNNLTGLSPQLFTLNKLEILELSSNPIEELPPDIGQLKRLKRLNLIGCDLRKLPESFGSLVDLTYLNLDSNTHLYTFPASFGNLRSLKELHIENFNLKEFPSIILNLQNLEIMIIYNHIDIEIPPEIINMKKLKYLNLIGRHYSSESYEFAKKINNKGGYEASFHTNNYDNLLKRQYDKPLITQNDFEKIIQMLVRTFKDAEIIAKYIWVFTHGGGVHLFYDIVNATARLYKKKKGEILNDPNYCYELMSKFIEDILNKDSRIESFLISRLYLILNTSRQTSLRDRVELMRIFESSPALQEVLIDLMREIVTGGEDSELEFGL